MKKIMATDQPWIRVSGVRVNAKWIREHCEHDINRDLPAVRCPALAITGSKDIQVLPEHARMLAEAVSGPAEWHIIPGMTHLLRRTEKEVDMIKLMKLYKEQIKKPVDGELLALLGSWIDATFPRGAEATA